MITLDVADLVVIASAALGIDTDAALDLLDVAAAQTALAAARPGDGADPAAAAAALLETLTRHRPFRRGNELIAVAAVLQFLGGNGWEADLDPPSATREVMAGLAAGTLTTAELAAWLSPRLSPRGRPRAKQTPMRRWLPGRTRQVPFGRMTSRARQVIVAAQDEARRLGHNYLGTEHILLGLLSDGQGVAARALAALGIGLDVARWQVEEITSRGRGAPPWPIQFTPRAKKALELSLREAMRLDHLYIGTEHILLGLIREGDGVAAQVLVKLGADLHRARREVHWLLAGRGPERPQPLPLPLPEVRDLDEQIAEVRRQKDAALDAGDLDRAAALRATEKRLLAERARLIDGGDQRTA